MNDLVHQKNKLEKDRQLDEDEDSKDEAPPPTVEETNLQKQIDEIEEQLRELDQPIAIKHAPRVLQPEILEQKAAVANPGVMPKRVYMDTPQNRKLGRVGQVYGKLGIRRTHKKRRTRRRKINRSKRL